MNGNYELPSTRRKRTRELLINVLDRMLEPARTADVQIENRGTIFLFTPLTSNACAWITENIQPDAQWYAGALVVEHRYARDLADRMISAGLTVE